MYMLTWLGDIKVLKGIGVRFPEPVRLEIIFPPVAAFFIGSGENQSNHECAYSYSPR